MNCFTKKLVLIIAPLMSVVFLTNCNNGGGGGGGGGVDPHTYTLSTKTENINISSNVLDNTKDYYGTIKINEGAKFALPEELFSVNVDDGDDTSIIHYCEYRRIKYNEASLTIPKEAIVGNIDFELDLINFYTLSTNSENVDISSDVLEEGADYIGTITVKSGIQRSIPEKLKSIKYVEGGSLLENDDYVFNRTGSKEATLKIFKHAIMANIVFEIELIEPLEEFDIKTSVSNITINPNKTIKGIDYIGTITLSESAEGYILPEELDSVIDNDGNDITDSCEYNRTADKEATLEIPKNCITSDIDFELTLVDPKDQRWYDHSDWWNYCSCDDAIIRADKTKDVGRVVKVTINNLVHEVRLIDCDKDIISGSSPTKTAHCTFEFKNVVSKTSGLEMKECWNPEGGNNFDYRSSTIFKYLDETILRLLPFKDKIQLVTKKVGVSTNSGDSYSPQPFDAKLFLLANDEMRDHVGYVVEGEGERYEYYKSHNDYEKFAVDGEECVDYWLRSPHISLTPRNRVCEYFTFFTYETVQFHYGVAPGFCI